MSGTDNNASAASTQTEDKPSITERAKAIAGHPSVSYIGAAVLLLIGGALGYTARGYNDRRKAAAQELLPAPATTHGDVAMH